MTQKDYQKDGEKVDIVMRLYNDCSLFELRAIQRMIGAKRSRDKRILNSGNNC